jgi:hypothetical protein
MTRRRDTKASAFVALTTLAAGAHGTWSIVLTDDETKEVAVGTVTCLTTFDLLAIVPVVVVGEGGAAVQSAGDFGGIRRPIIFDELRAGTPPEEILAILEGISGHQERQYGIVDTAGGAVTFTGTQNGAWAGGMTGSQGSMHYAVQGNVLAGACVVSAIEDAILATEGDFAAKMMAGMEAARDAGGDGRCSCSPGQPTMCGCPPITFDKSGHIGGMIVARSGDVDDDACEASGCADGDYYMRLNVSFADEEDPDPVDELRVKYDHWEQMVEGRPDAVRSSVDFCPPVIPPNGVAMTTMTVTLVDRDGLPVKTPLDAFTVDHGAGSAGHSTVGPIVDQGGGVYDVTITAGTAAGVDRFVVVADNGERAVTLMPEPEFEYFALGDLDGSGAVDIADLVDLLAAWGPCPPPPDGCIADLDGSGTVDVADLVLLLLAWT